MRVVDGGGGERLRLLAGMRAQAGKARRGNTLLAAARGGIRVRGLPPKWQMC
jgi:hypothetical protein